MGMSRRDVGKAAGVAIVAGALGVAGNKRNGKNGSKTDPIQERLKKEPKPGKKK